MSDPRNISDGTKISRYLEPLPKWDILSKQVGNGWFVFHAIGAIYMMLSFVSIYLSVKFRQKICRRTNTLILLLTMNVTGIVMGAYLIMDPYALKGCLPVFLVNLIEQCSEPVTIVAFIALQNDLICLASVTMKWNKFQSSSRILFLISTFVGSILFEELVYTFVTPSNILRLVSKLSVIVLSLFTCVCFLCTGFKTAVYLDSMKSTTRVYRDDISESNINPESDITSPVKNVRHKRRTYKHNGTEPRTMDCLLLESSDESVHFSNGGEVNEDIANHCDGISQKQNSEYNSDDFSCDLDMRSLEAGCSIETEAAIHAVQKHSTSKQSRDNTRDKLRDIHYGCKTAVSSINDKCKSVVILPDIASNANTTEKTDYSCDSENGPIVPCTTNNVTKDLECTGNTNDVSTKPTVYSRQSKLIITSTDTLKLTGTETLSCDSNEDSAEMQNYKSKESQDKYEMCEKETDYVIDVECDHVTTNLLIDETDINSEQDGCECNNYNDNMKLDQIQFRNDDTFSILDNGYLADGETITVNTVSSSSNVIGEKDYTSGDDLNEARNTSSKSLMIMKSPSSSYSLIRLRQCVMLQRVVSIGYFITFGCIVDTIFQMYSLFGVYGIFGSRQTPDPWPWFLFHLLHRCVCMTICVLLILAVFCILNNRTRRRKKQRQRKSILDTKL